MSQQYRGRYRASVWIPPQINDYLGLKYSLGFNYTAPQASVFYTLNIQFPQGDANTDKHRICHCKMSKPTPNPIFYRGCREMPRLIIGLQSDENIVSWKHGKLKCI